MMAKATSTQRYEGPREFSLAQYDERKFNVLSPTQVVQRISPLHTLRASVVQIDTTEGGGDAYFNRAFMSESERALSKNGLHKLARAAGLKFRKDLSGRRDDNSDRGYREYEATYEMRCPDGSSEFFSALREVDTRPGGAVEAGLKRQAAAKMKPRKYGNKEYPPDLKTQTEADAWVERELAAAREHALSNAESKAKLRAIREALSIKSKYTLDELNKPFVVPRIDFSPDYTDPEVRRLMLTAGAQAQGMLYGGQAALPAPQVVDAQTRVVDPSLPDQQREMPPDRIHRAPDTDDDSEQMAFDEIPPHDVETGEVVDPLTDLRAAVQGADKDALRALKDEAVEGARAGKYGPDQVREINAMLQARAAELAR